MPMAYGGIVYEPDLRLVAGVRKLARQLQEVVSATLTVVNEIGVSFSVLGLLRSRDPHR